VEVAFVAYVTTVLQEEDCLRRFSVSLGSAHLHKFEGG